MTQIYLTQTSRFTASHSHEGNLNEPAHSHTFTYEVSFHGPINEEGYLLDFRDVEHLLTQQINPELEGTDLNTLFEHPTTEAIAVWIYSTVKRELAQVCRVRVYEAPDRWAEYTGEE